MEQNNILERIHPIKNYKERFTGNRIRTVPRISTGWLSVDKALNGGLANELYIMAAETSTGKSAFMMAMAQNVAKQGINVLYFSLEMGTDYSLQQLHHCTRRADES